MDELTRSRLLATFRSDTERRLDAAERGLLALETSGDPDLVAALFRDVHTVKGDALSVELRVLGELLHAAEDLIERMIERGAVPAPRSTTLLLAVVDFARDALDRQASGAPEPPRATALRMIAELAACDDFMQTTRREGKRSRKADRRRKAIEIPVTVLDELVRLVGELKRAPRRELEGSGAMHADVGARATSELERLALGMRTVPLQSVVQGAERAARDLALALGKRVRLVPSGEDLAVDFAVRDVVSAALVHLVRNAIDHGIEEPAARAQRGKDPTGTLRVAFAIADGHLTVEVADDGEGVDPQRVRARAHELGLAVPESPGAILPLLLRPGFSTRDEVSDVSGRGVGLDAVADEVRTARGQIDLRSTPGQGATVTLRLPLAVAIIEGLQVRSDGGRFIVPTRSIVGCRPFVASRTTFGGRCGVYTDERGALPFVDLDAFASPHASRHGAPSRRAGTDERTLVEVRVGDARAGIVVGATEGIERIVMSALDPILRTLPFLAGTAVLADGRVGLVLEVDELVRHLEGERVLAEVA